MNRSAAGGVAAGNRHALAPSTRCTMCILEARPDLDGVTIGTHSCCQSFDFAVIRLVPTDTCIARRDGAHYRFTATDSTFAEAITYRRSTIVRGPKGS